MEVMSDDACVGVSKSFRKLYFRIKVVFLRTYKPIVFTSITRIQDLSLLQIEDKDY